MNQFEENLKDNLYKIWNFMSSGTYFPPPVKAVEIPKKSGGVRMLGIPAVADRIAQIVAKIYFEPEVEPYFLADSFGYRAGKSALDAVEVTRQRCWRYDWVVEFDIRGLFDNISHDLLMCAVRKHTECKWVILYIERWPLCRKLTGHYNYYGLTHNYRSLKYYYQGVCRIWHKWLNRRSRKRDLSWPDFNRLLKHHPLPLPRVVHSVYRRTGESVP